MRARGMTVYKQAAKAPLFNGLDTHQFLFLPKKFGKKTAFYFQH